ncbi:dicarboxylate/amino acid:cation symporter [Desulfitobacterium sp. AusDCA]|uniref:dicarboxylate/amino acid:cation symporter n=1 Tax=Desulfitobacterium sp. AusDCA TaxID=3240383 RepID=UPI003DA75818
MAGKKRISLGVQVLIGLVLGLILGFMNKQLGLSLEGVGQAFLKLIQMVIVPLVFPLIVLSVATIKDVKSLGRLAGKLLIYFEIVTTIVIIMGVTIAKITNVGVGTIVSANAAGVDKLSKGIDLGNFFLNIIPSNVVKAMADGQLLPIIFFGLFLGLALAAIGEKGKPVLEFLDSWTQAMFKVIEYAISFAPIGVFGFIAYDVAKYGLTSLLSLGQFVLIAYVGFLSVIFILFPIISLIFKVPYFQMLKEIWDLILLAFTTRSSEVALPPLIDRLEKFGVKRSVASFVLPLGYSFNLDGASLYASLAVIFIANVYGIHLSLTEIVIIIGILMMLTKGLAGVPSAVMVVLLATAQQTGLPPEGIALLMGVDFFVDMGRTALNVVGNSTASVILAKSEKAFRVPEDIDTGSAVPLTGK